MRDSRFPDSPVVRLSWPDEGGLALPEASARLGLDDVLAAVTADWKTLRALEKAPAPIIGVMGLLNAGKSSLVKQFLSPAGRARILTGVGKAQGTQRFVFWLPAAWKNDPAVWGAFREVLESAFGNQLEEMSDDPVRAAAQYQGNDDVAASFAVPLIAFDPALDASGFCLLDCPDFEREHPGDASGVRVDFVRRASKLLSAVLIIGERDRAASGILLLPFNESESRENERTAADLGLSNIPVFLLLNKLNFHEEQPEEIVHDGEIKQLMSRLGVRRVFGAYHGRLDKAEEKIPHPFRTADYDPALPYFFELSGNASENAPDAVGEVRLLAHHLRDLQPAALWAARRESKALELDAGLTRLEARIRERLHEQRHFLSKKRQALIDFIRDQVRSRDNQLAFPLLPETAAAIAEAVAASAPWYAKPAMWATQGVKQMIGFIQSARDLIRLNQTLGDPGKLAREGAAAIKKNAAKAGVRTFEPAEWARLSRNQKFMPDAASDEALTRLWAAVQDATMELKIELNPEKTREFAALLWDQMSWSKKIMLGAMGPVLLIGAMASVVFAMFDGGASSIFLFFSIKELLIACGLSGAAVATTIKGGERLEAYLIERAGIPFYGRLLRAALDAFGLPLQGENPLVEHFENTGKFEVHLDRTPGEAKLTTQIDLAEGRILGDVSPKDWKQLHTHLLSDRSAV